MSNSTQIKVFIGLRILFYVAILAWSIRYSLDILEVTDKPMETTNATVISFILIILADRSAKKKIKKLKRVKL